MELTPNIVEDVELGSERLCCNHTKQFLCLHWCLNFDKCDERRCAELTLNSFGYTDNCPGCANARAGRKQAVDHSEQCRSRMGPLLMTTSEGHQRLERARDRFAQVAKESEDEGPQRKRHRVEGEGEGSLLRHQHQQWWSWVSEATTKKVAAVAAVQRCRFRLRHRHLNHHHRLKNEVWNRSSK